MITNGFHSEDGNITQIPSCSFIIDLKTELPMLKSVSVGDSYIEELIDKLSPAEGINSQLISQASQCLSELKDASNDMKTTSMNLTSDKITATWSIIDDRLHISALVSAGNIVDIKNSYALDLAIITHLMAHELNIGVGIMNYTIAAPFINDGDKILCDEMFIRFAYINNYNSVRYEEFIETLNAFDVSELDYSKAESLYEEIERINLSSERDFSKLDVDEGILSMLSGMDVEKLSKWLDEERTVVKTKIDSMKNTIELYRTNKDALNPENMNNIACKNPVLWLNPEVKKFSDFTKADIDILNYHPMP